MRALLFPPVLFLLTACSAAPGDKSAASNAPAAETPLGNAPAPVEEPALTPAGYDGITVGQKIGTAGHGLVDAGGFDGPCRIYTSPDLPGMSVLVEDDVIQRISAHQGFEDRPGSTAQTAEGISVGDSADKVRAAYPVLAESPHTYTDGIYLDWLPAGAKKPGLRFEITSGKVTDIHAGQPPALFYVEGCA